MRLHSALISSCFLASAVLANDSWAMSGSVTLTRPNHESFHGVSASLQIPKLSGDPSGMVAVLVNLGGESCSSSVSAGIICSADQSLGCLAYYVAAPDGPTAQLNDFPINTGDTVVFGLNVSTNGRVDVFHENIATGQSQISTLLVSNPCARQAGWFIANVPSADPVGSFSPVANFGTMSLTNAVAYDLEGDVYGPGSPKAQASNMVSPDGTTLANVIASANIVTFTYNSQDLDTHGIGG